MIWQPKGYFQERVARAAHLGVGMAEMVLVMQLKVTVKAWQAT